MVISVGAYNGPSMDGRDSRSPNNRFLETSCNLPVDFAWADAVSPGVLTVEPAACRFYPGPRYAVSPDYSSWVKLPCPGLRLVQIYRFLDYFPPVETSLTSLQLQASFQLARTIL
jgi:hypothetical protein